MKKLRLILAFILILVASLPLFNKAEAFAEQNSSDKVQTGIFLPTSYLQYYKLDNPYALCRYKDDSEDFVAISQKNSIVIYRDEKFSKIDLVNESDKPVTTLQRYDNYLLYLYKSVVWALDISEFGSVNWVAPEAEKISNPSSPFNILASNSSFSVCEDKIVCFDSDFIYLYKISTDSFGGLKVDEITKTPQESVTKLLLSQNGMVYFAKSAQKGIFVWDGNTVSTFNAEASTVRTLAESDDGETLYYSCAEGIYSLDIHTATSTLIKEVTTNSTNPDLGAIYEPQGICLFEDKLWVVDSEINAVQEIDLANENEFTQFAITTNSTAVNRLTSGVKDITVDKDVIYALDSGRIVAIKDIDSLDRKYSRINLGYAPVNEFSAGNGYVCYSNGNVVNICNVEPLDEEGIEYSISTHKSLTFTDASQIIDISYSEGYFYVCFTATYDNVNHPCIYRINTKTEYFLAEQIIFEQTEVGSAIEVTADVFGTVYYCSRNASNYEFYSFEANELKLVAKRPYESNLLNLQTDFDGKLYALYENNAIDIIEYGSVTSKTLETSPNLGEINPAKSMCLSYKSQTAYFIFEGLILSSSNVADLNISTPHTISIPQDFSLAYNSNQQFASVKEGAKLFEIDVTELDGEYFKFIDNFEADSPETDYAVIPLNDKYSLLIKDGVSAVARNSDVLSTRSAEAENLKKYAVVAFTPYSIPVLEAPYKNAEGIAKYQLTEIVGKITFNEINYYIVKCGETYGYVPDTFVVDSIITEDGNLNVSDVYVYKKGGIIVYDGDGNQIGTIQKKTKVTVLEKGNKLTIIFGDSVGYINSDCIVSSSKAEILKSVAIILGALSICVTALYFEKRYLLKRR